MPANVAFKNPEKEDLERIVLVRNISRRELPEHRDETPEEVEADIFNPVYDSNGCWIAFTDDKVVGYAAGFVESGRLKAGRKEARVDLEVLPSHRGQGIEKKLVERVLSYVRARGMNSALARCEAVRGWKNELILSSGFKDVHHWYRMIRVGRSRPEPHVLPPGFRLVSSMLNQISDKDMNRFASVSNSAFSEVFDFFPVTSEDMIRFRDSTPDIDRTAWVERDGEMVGFCMSEESAAYNKERNSKMGYILALCVLKPHRGLGIGAALLADGMQWVLDRGMDQIYLAVDAENPGALRIYTSHGFSVLREGVYYRINLSSVQRSSD